ncbi:hypothetical protein N2152v2_002731 [Parachlorella kessleri]
MHRRAFHVARQPAGLLALLLALASLQLQVDAVTKTEADDAQVLRLWKQGFLASKTLQPFLDTWVLSRPCTSKWWGVGCSLVDGQQRVTAIDLDLFNLNPGPEIVLLETGIPGILADLPLKSFQIRGKIVWVGDQGIRTCRIKGALPGAFAKKSTALIKLVVRGCHMEVGLPAHTQLPPNLEYLDMSSDELTGGLLPGWANLKQLKYVNLNHTSIKGPLMQAKWMPPSIEYYDVSYNQLTGGVPDWSSLTKLRRLEMSANNLEGSLPMVLPPNLEELFILYNRLSGSLPGWAASQGLKTIYLAVNQLTGSLPDYTPLKSLTGLGLDNNRLSGQLSGLFPTSIKWLGLYNNGFTGSVPDLSHLPSLTSIALYDNQISVAPEAAFLPPSLQSLSLSRNKMKGPMPDYSSHPNLQELSFSENLLDGSLPDVTLLPSSLVHLDLRMNKFSGLLPGGWAVLKKLETVTLEYNKGLIGSIPKQWGNGGAMSSIYRIVLKPGTGLCGPIPKHLEHHVYKYDPATQYYTELPGLGRCPTI